MKALSPNHWTTKEDSQGLTFIIQKGKKLAKPQGDRTDGLTVRREISTGPSPSRDDEVKKLEAAPPGDQV